MKVRLLLLMNETEPPPIQPAFLVSLVVDPRLQQLCCAGSRDDELLDFVKYST